MSAQKNSNTDDVSTGVEIVVDPHKLERFQQDLRDNQNLSMGMLGGLLAAALGAIVWAGITYAAEYQVGIMAVGIGYIVGLAVKKMGAGVDQSFGIVGAGCALLGCLAGNILMAYVMISNAYDAPLMDFMLELDSAALIELMKYLFDPMDTIFYVLAVYFGYKYSIRKVTKDEMKRLV